LDFFFLQLLYRTQQKAIEKWYYAIPWKVYFVCYIWITNMASIWHEENPLYEIEFTIYYLNWKKKKTRIDCANYLLSLLLHYTVATRIMGIIRNLNRKKVTPGIIQSNTHSLTFIRNMWQWTVKIYILLLFQSFQVLFFSFFFTNFCSMVIIYRVLAIFIVTVILEEKKITYFWHSHLLHLELKLNKQTNKQKTINLYQFVWTITI